MGKVKIKKKSTFIDMTAMSDVTVLLLTFFMLTSTFLQKEPTVVFSPSSVSEEPVPISNLVTVLVSAADKSDKLNDDPDARLVQEGKLFISFAGDSILGTPEFRAKVLDEALSIYNEEHEKAQVTLTPAQKAAFIETNMMGTSFADLPAVLDLTVTDRDKLMSGLGTKDVINNPATGKPLTVGIPINDNKDKEKNFNDFQIWCRAIYNVSTKNHNDYTDAAMLTEDQKKALDDLYNALTKDGKGIAVKADKDTPFTVIQQVFDNLQTMKLNKFSLYTALTSEDEVAPSN